MGSSISTYNFDHWIGYEIILYILAIVNNKIVHVKFQIKVEMQKL
jgi:hypothetical protein